MNVAEEAVAEELLPYKELFTSVVPGQDHKTAATSCFGELKCKHNEFYCKGAELYCQRDEVDCKGD